MEGLKVYMERVDWDQKQEEGNRRVKEEGGHREGIHVVRLTGLLFPSSTSFTLNVLKQSIKSTTLLLVVPCEDQ